MTENQLSAKELYEQKHAEKLRERGSSEWPKAPKQGNSWLPWVIGVLVLAGIVSGLYKMATSTPPGGTSGTLATLADPVTAGEWTSGSASSTIQVVEYSDLQCPACAAYAPWVEQLRKEKDIAVTYRHFPLRSIHPNGQIVAQVAEAAGLQGDFWEAVDLIFAGQSKWSEQIAPRETLYSLLAPLKLNLTKLKTDVDSKIVKDNIDWDLASGERSQVRATPTFFVNGKQLQTNPAPTSYEDFVARIRDAGQS